MATGSLPLRYVPLKTAPFDSSGRSFYFIVTRRYCAERDMTVADVATSFFVLNPDGEFEIEQ
nr:hypothetical protein KXZ65_14255 [Pectobacterium sp. PL152]